MLLVRNAVLVAFFGIISSIGAFGQAGPSPTFVGKWQWQNSTIEIPGSATPQIFTPAKLGVEMTMELRPDDMMYLYRNGELVYKGQFAINKSGAGIFIFAWDSDQVEGDPKPEVGPIDITQNELTLTSGVDEGGLFQQFIRVK
ncbi:MAG: hypothetical protein KDC24_02470 [Saprospiraceae bacterium]|nr:hypothetical protein [Saprospiraceae bacterium]